MTDEDAMEFGTLMARLGIIFRRSIPKAVADEYFKALSGLTLRAVRFGVEHAIKNNERFPTPAQLRKAAYEPRSQRAPTAEEKIERDEEHAKVAFKLIQEIMADKPTPEVRARLFWGMHAKWPNYGWDEAALDAESLATTKTREETWQEHHHLHLRLGIRCRCGLPNPMNPVEA